MLGQQYEVLASQSQHLHVPERADPVDGRKRKTLCFEPAGTAAAFHTETGSVGQIGQYDGAGRQRRSRSSAAGRKWKDSLRSGNHSSCRALSGSKKACSTTGTSATRPSRHFTMIFVPFAASATWT